MTGTANPYDTGGTLKGHCRPFADIDGEDERRRRVRELLDAMLAAVPGWREDLEKYLTVFYSVPEAYVLHEKPNLQPEDAPADLPALHVSPEADPRAWTWEVRLYSRASLTDNLKQWACDDATESRLKREASSTSIPVGAVSDERTIWQCLDETPHVVRVRKREAFEVLAQTVQDEVLA